MEVRLKDTWVERKRMGADVKLGPIWIGQSGGEGEEGGGRCREAMVTS